MVKARNHEKGYFNGLVQSVNDEIGRMKLRSPENLDAVRLHYKWRVLTAVCDRLLDIIDDESVGAAERGRAALLKIKTDDIMAQTEESVESIMGGGVTDMATVSVVAEALEREWRARTGYVVGKSKDGIKKALDSGVNFGRKPMEKPGNFDDVAALYRDGKISLREAGRQCVPPVSHPTFARMYERFGSGEEL